ncbi:MAG: prepilin-type N-terminal cleavage/methylation domain-containing protein [Lachnospiraceae bacterium]|nr:prepilin-type N-terminal cleavage/methylation domain-containing protein [Lachnospiraceae bacterium]
MKHRNHGFSLVELVVVVAIMAVLVGILAPAYLSYIEKTRIQKDESAAGEIYRAAEIVVYTGEYDISDQVLVTFNSEGISLNLSIENPAEVETILKEHFGDQYQTAVPVSKKYKDSTYTVTILPPEEGSYIPRLSGAWSP